MKIAGSIALVPAPTEVSERRSVAHSSTEPGAVVVAGTEPFWSVVRIEQRDSDCQVHFGAVPPVDPAAVHLVARAA
jgi:hypothetical protein